MKLKKYTTALLIAASFAWISPANIYAQQEESQDDPSQQTDYSFTAEEAHDFLGFDRIPEDDKVFSQIAFLRSNDPNDQENAALRFFRAAYPTGQVLTPEEFMNKTELQLRSISLLWIHADRPSLSDFSQDDMPGRAPKEWRKVAAHYTSGSDEDIDAFAARLALFTGKEEPVVTEYDPTKGSNLYLSGQAVLLLYGMGRLPETLPMIYGEDLNKKLNGYDDVWKINSNFNGDEEHEYHAIYGSPNPATGWELKQGYLVPLDNHGGIYETMAPADGVESLGVFDHNCMWDTANLPEGVERSYGGFRKAYHCVGLGAWGHHTEGVTELGIVEFLPGHATAVGSSPADSWNDYRHFNGNIIANGMACCQFLPDPKDGNRFQQNIYALTFNTINYLTGEFQENPDVTKLTAYQLVKILNPEDEYNYVTYYGSETSPAACAYLLKVDVADDDASPKLLDYKAIDYIPDYADGNKYQFSCKVLLVTNALSENRRANVKGYQLKGMDSSAKKFDETKTFDDEEAITGESRYRDWNDDPESFTTTYMPFNEGADQGRYFRIVEPRITLMEDDNNYEDIDPGFRYTYSVRMLYTADSGDKISEPGKVSYNLVMPSPRLVNAHMEMFYGKDTDDKSNNETMSFVYDDFKLVKARYQNLHKVIEIEIPNITPRYRAKAVGYIQEKIGEEEFLNNTEFAPISTGLFALQVVAGKNGEDVIESSLYNNDYYLQPDEDNVIRIEGETHVHDHLTTETYRKVTMSISEKFVTLIPVFNRWEDTDIKPLEITDNMPALQSLEGKTEMNKFVKVVVEDLSYNDEDHLIETDAITLRLRTSRFDLTTDEDKEVLINEQLYGVSEEGTVESNVEDGVNYAKRFDVDDSFALARPLKFGACDDGDYNDYYLVTLTDENEEEIQKMIVSAREFSEGKLIRVTKDLGARTDGQYDESKDNPYFRNLKISISYLYPFDHVCTDPEHNFREMAMRRIDSSAEGDEDADDNDELGTDVMLSQPAVLDLLDYRPEVPTSVENMTVEDCIIRTGKGYIDVPFGRVSIYSAMGVKVASGEGRHNLPGGIYIVCINNSTKKIMVS